MYYLFLLYIVKFVFYRVHISKNLLVILLDHNLLCPYSHLLRRLSSSSKSQDMEFGYLLYTTRTSYWWASYWLLLQWRHWSSQVYLIFWFLYFYLLSTRVGVSWDWRLTTLLASHHFYSKHMVLFQYLLTIIIFQ